MNKKIYDIDLKSKKFPEVIPAFIEISKNSRVKYEWNNDLNVLELDRVLHSSVVYPENYGFIPQTLCDDGDPLDVLILSNQKIIPGSLASIRPICFLEMIDEKGTDEKLIAVFDDEPDFKSYKNLSHISYSKLLEIKEFFKTYKNLEKNKWVKVGEYKDIDPAIDLIKNSHDLYFKNKV